MFKRSSAMDIEMRAHAIYRRQTFDFMPDVTFNNLLDFVLGINNTIIAFIFEGPTHTYRICAVLTLYIYIMRFFYINFNNLSEIALDK